MLGAHGRWAVRVLLRATLTVFVAKRFAMELLLGSTSFNVWGLYDRDSNI